MFILKNVKVPEIRIIPMSKEEFDYKPSEDIQQEYFLNKLFYRDECKYYCGKRAIDSKEGSLLLFQYDNKIIASAQFVNVIEGENKAIVVDKNTIEIFNPIEVNELKNMDSKFNKFSQAKQFLDISKLKKIIDLLKMKKEQYNMTYQEKVLSAVVGDENFEDKPKDKNEVSKGIINQWARDPMTAKRALINANFKCAIDERHEHFKAKATGESYVESHHLIPMRYQDEFDYSLDIEANIVSLCVVCHKKFHHAELNEKKDMLYNLFKQREDRLKKCGLNISFDELLELYK